MFSTGEDGPPTRCAKVLFEFKYRRRGSACDCGGLHHDTSFLPIIGDESRVPIAAIPPTNHQKRSTPCKCVLPRWWLLWLWLWLWLLLLLPLLLLLLLLTDALHYNRIRHGILAGCYRSEGNASMGARCDFF